MVPTAGRGASVLLWPAPFRAHKVPGPRGRALRPASQAGHTAVWPRPGSLGLCPGTGRPASPGAPRRHFLRKPSHFQAPCQAQGCCHHPDPGDLCSLLVFWDPPRPVPSKTLGFQHRTHKPAEATRQTGAQRSLPSDEWGGAQQRASAHSEKPSRPAQHRGGAHPRRRGTTGGAPSGSNPAS